jgi:hypothetical protein
MSRGNLIFIGILIVVGIGGFLFRDRLSGSAAELKVGDCFVVPPAEEQTVDDVQHHPCTDEHSGEVFFVGKSSAAKDAAFAREDLKAEVFAICDPAFVTYTGKDSNTDPVWSYGYFIPTSESWGDGERGISCYALKIDGSTSTGSIKVN